MGEGGETEKQKNRFVSRGPEAHLSQARHQAGRRGSSADTQGPRPPQHPQYTNVASRETICGLLGPAPDPNHAVHPGRGQNHSLPPEVACPGTQSWAGIQVHAMRAAGLAPASQRVAVPRQEATSACLPCPGQAAQTLTVGDVPETLGIQQVPQPRHLVLQLTD